MTFLPIVERELRVASRRRFTYWSRIAGAGFLLVIFGMMLAFLEIARSAGFSIGQVTFVTLRWIAFVFTASVGVFLTSDSLSEEKREGTMGLLFLTDLRGHDVVFGKLMSQSLQSFYGLLAAFPILALPLMAGGVTGVEFGRTLLILCNTLFLSLATGLLVSSFSREVIKAMSGALFLTLLLLVGLPWLDLGIAHWDETRWKAILSVASPGYLFAEAPSLWPKDYWFCLGLQHLLGWIFLVTACVIVPRAWQEKATGGNHLLARLSSAWRFGTRRARLAFRRKRLGHAPVFWLATRDRWLPRAVVAMTLLFGGVLVWDFYVESGMSGLRTGPSWHVVLMLIIVVWVGTQACRFYLEAVRTGAMELLLVTPVTPREIVRSQWTAIWRTFWVPVLLLVVMMILNGIEGIRQMKMNMSGVTVTSSSPNFDFIHMQIAQLCIGVFNFLFRTTAMVWFGMWLGLTSRKVSIAVLKILLFVCVLPWIVEMFLQGACMAYFSFAQLPFWFGLIPPAVLELAKNIFFIAWSRQRLLNRFRETVAQAGQSSVVISRTGVGGVAPAAAPRPVIT